MASEGALIIVRELHEVLQLPKSADTASAVPQMLASLKHFVSSSDSRVRFYAVRAVASLARDYREEISDHSWISQAQRRMARGENEGDLSNAKILADAISALIGTEIPSGDEDENVCALQPEEQLSGISDRRNFRSPLPTVTTSLFRLLPVTDEEDTGGSGVGNVFFSVADISDRMASELQLAIVKIPGVISAFINADFLVLTTRGVSEISSGNFFSDLRRVVEAVSDRLFTLEEISDQHLESTTLATEEDSAYLDEDERFAARAKKFPTFFSATFASRGIASVQKRLADMEIVEVAAEQPQPAAVQSASTQAPSGIGNFFRRLFS